MSNTGQSTNQRKKTRNSAPVDLSTMVYGKVPPQAKELEEAILGAIMLEKGAFDKAAEILQPECFYLDAHQRVYRAMQGLSKANQPIDIFTVVEQLKTTSELDIVGGAYYVTKLTNAVVSSANLAAHARIVYQKYVKREVIRCSGEMIQEAYEEGSDAFDLVESLESRMAQLAISRTLKPYQSIGSVAQKAVDQIYQAKITQAEITGVPSGLPVLDAITQGWQPTNLIVLAARPGIGKSALAGNLAINAATHTEKPTSVGIFSLEMGSIQWVMRMLSGSTGIGLYNLKRGRVNDEEMKAVQQAGMVDYQKLGIFFDDTPGMDIYQLKSKARMMVLKDKVGLLIIDYLQLMSGNKSNNENREQEVASISRGLKHLAKELNIPVIALSQLNRQGDTGEPRLGQLRESGAIEQDADDVLFITVPDELAVQADASLQHSILLHIAKHRNGILQKLPVKFIKDIQKIMTENEYDRYITGRTWKPVQGGLFPHPDQSHSPQSPKGDDEMPF